ncbi:MAG: hypothetical protein ABJN35_04060 [Erythrobacter sp.]
MTQRATPISISAKAFITGAAFALALPGAVNAQVIDEEPDVEDVARTPLEDFNIDSDDIPEILVEAARDPYASDGLRTCNDIVAQIAALDSVLGADFDIAATEGRRLSRGRVAQSVVGSFIPFRGIVREVSGANSKRREVNMAITSGMVRRGFLKGLGQQRGCDYPARPRADRGSLTADN